MTLPFSFCPACGKPAPDFDGHKALHCTACGLHYFHNVAAAVGVFIKHEEHVLFAVRGRSPGAGMLDLPGGFLEPGETLEQGLKREIAEELGIELPPPRYLFSFANNYQYEGVLYRTADALFEVTYEQRPAVTPADDVAAVQWRKLTDIAGEDVAFVSIRRAIAVLRGEPMTNSPASEWPINE
jgi:NAD+ diphosphatase